MRKRSGNTVPDNRSSVMHRCITCKRVRTKHHTGRCGHCRAGGSVPRQEPRRAVCTVCATTVTTARSGVCGTCTQRSDQSRSTSKDSVRSCARLPLQDLSERVAFYAQRAEEKLPLFDRRTPYELLACGFTWDAPQQCWVRPDGLEIRAITASCWRLSRAGQDGCRLITTRQHDQVSQLTDLGKKLALALEEISKREQAQDSGI